MKQKDFRRCSEYERNSSRYYFYKNISTRDRLNLICKSCWRGNYIKSYEKILEYRKEYNKQNRAKIKIYEKKRQTDFNFELIGNIRTRTNKAFRSQNTRKTNKIIDLIGRPHPFFKRWILHQLYGIMTEDNYGSIWTIDHCYPLSKTILSDENEMSKSTFWINLRPMFLGENS